MGAESLLRAEWACLAGGASLLKTHPAGEIFLAQSMHDDVQGVAAAGGRSRPAPRHCDETWEHIEEDDDDDDFEDAHTHHDGEASPWDSTDEDCRSPKDGPG